MVSSAVALSNLYPEDSQQCWLEENLRQRLGRCFWVGSVTGYATTHSCVADSDVFFHGIMTVLCVF